MSPMIIRKHTHYAIVFNYFFAKNDERTRYCNANNVFYEGTILYSYGRHFALAVKSKNGYILNGDRYSNTTSGHQSLTRTIADLHWFAKSHMTGGNIRNPEGLRSMELRHSTEKKNCSICSKLSKGHKPVHHAIIPFSALQGAGVNAEDIVIIDVTEDTLETVKRKNPKTGEIEEYHIHHLGASLFRVGTRRFFSSIDTGARGWGSFYLVELKSRRINTVDDAYRDLAGNLDDKQYSEYQLGRIKRQGEYFLIPQPGLTTRELKKKAKKMPVKLKGVLDVKVKTSHSKRIVNNVIHRENMGYGGCSREQIQVIRKEGVPYYVLLERDHAGMQIPKDSFIKDGHLVTRESLVHQFDLSNGVGNPHVARDAIKTSGGIFIRKTLRHNQHRMIRMCNIWHRVIKNTAIDSWSSSGNVD